MNFFTFSANLLSRMFHYEYCLYTSITLAACNMIIQIFFDMAFGGKGSLRLGAKR